MITKELLIEVLNVPIIGNIRIHNHKLGFDTDIKHACCAKHSNGMVTYPHESINIYELAHKCKEWAFSKYAISLFSARSKYGGWICTFDEYIGDYENTEPEAIFKACQWILDSKDKQ